MSVFPTSKHLCSWAGLTPQNNEVPERRNQPVSVVRALISSHCLFNVLFVLFAKRTAQKSATVIFLCKKRKGHKKAIIAIARMLLTAICNILKKNEPYNPELYHRVNTPSEHRTVFVDGAIFILQRQGYLVTSATP